MGYVDAAEEWLDSWVARVDASAVRAVELSQRVAALTGKARSDLLAVTVGASGTVERLDIDDRATQQFTGAELSRKIMALVRRARADLSAQVAEQVERTVGSDTETGRAVLHSYASRLPRRSVGGDSDEW